jgi:hypothetical protein
VPKASGQAGRAKLAWVKFVPNFDYYCKFASIQNFDEIEAQWIKEVNDWREFYEANKIDYDALRKETSSLKEFHKLEAEKRAELFSHQSRFFHLEEMILDTMYAIYREAEFSDGKLLLKANEIQLLKANFEIALVAFVQWLQSLGCDVTYEFRQG